APGGGGPSIRREVIDPTARPLEVRLIASDVPPAGSFEVTEVYPLSGIAVSSISTGGSQFPVPTGIGIRWVVSSATLSMGLGYRVTLPPGSRVEPVGSVD